VFPAFTTGLRADPEGLRQINPTGRISLSFSSKSLFNFRHPVPEQGALAIVTGRWDGMRWTRRHRARDGIAGRDKLRERSQGAPTSGAEAYGEVVWFRCLSGRHQVFRKARRPNRAIVPVSGRRRRQESPILREERDISRKAIAQGMSDRLRCPVCSCAIFLSPLHTGPRVQRASGIPCSLVVSRDNERRPRACGAARTRMCICCLTFESMGRPGQASITSADPGPLRGPPPLLPSLREAAGRGRGWGVYRQEALLR